MHLTANVINQLEGVAMYEKKTKMVFCYQNCSDLLWEKNVLVIEKNFWNFEAGGQELANILRSLDRDQFIETVKSQNFFGNLQEKLKSILTSYALSFVFDSNNMWSILNDWSKPRQKPLDPKIRYLFFEEY